MQLYSLDPEELMKTAKSAPDLRRMGILPSTGAEGTPFDALAMTLEGAFKQQAIQLANRYKAGLIKDEDADKMANQLLTASTAHMDRGAALAQANATHALSSAFAQDKLNETKRINDQKILDAEEKKKQAEEKKLEALKAQDSLLTSLGDQVDTVRTHPGRESASTAFVGSLVSSIPKTDALAFKNQLETLKSKSFINNVQGMRGLGSLSNSEGNKVINLISSLDPQMKKTDFDKALNEIDKYVKNGRENIARQGRGEKPVFLLPDSEETKPTAKAPQQTAQDADAKAIAWARSNPTNPDAKEILRLHGLTK